MYSVGFPDRRLDMHGIYYILKHANHDSYIYTTARTVKQGCSHIMLSKDCQPDTTH